MCLLEVRALVALPVAGLSIGNLGNGIGSGNGESRLLVLNDTDLETRGILCQDLLTMETVKVVFIVYVSRERERLLSIVVPVTS